MRVFLEECRRSLARAIRHPALREVLLFSLPALCLGLALRAFLTARMPWGFVQYDSAEYLATPYRLLNGHSFYVNGKRGFLVPILYAIPFLLRVPALIAIPLGQHLLGLCGVFMSGALVRFWFRHWRWFILPVTLWVAAFPSSLWYEQTLMGESEFLNACLFLAAAGTLWARRPSRPRFAMLLAALVFTAGARPEGRLFFGFGILLAVLVLWPQWRSMARGIGAILLAALLGSLLVRASTAPQLLYASLIQLTPDRSRLLPGVEPYIIPLRDLVRTSSGGDPQGLVKVSKQIRDAIDPYLRTKSKNGHGYYRELNKTLRDLCLEAILAHPVQAAAIPFQKFRLAVDCWPAYRFDAGALYRNQKNTYHSDAQMYAALGRGLTGKTLDEPGEEAFVQEHYHPESVAWLGRYQAAWNNATIYWRTADRPAVHTRYVHDFAGGVPGGLAAAPGLPWFYPLAALGMLSALVCPRPSRCVHWAWVPVMLAVWFGATFVGVTNARYRFAYEPFCFIYLCLLLDGVAGLVVRPARAEA